MDIRLTGLIAATYTPLNEDGSLHLAQVPKITDQLLAEGVSGLYVCGSTGEGVSLTTAERKAMAQAYVQAAAGRVPVIVQVGHNSLADACDLAAHAQRIRADVVSATPPSYFKVASTDLLIDCMAEIATAAPGLPFYYYHIPALSGVAVDVAEFLRRAGERIANLAGVKYTAQALDEYQACIELDDQRYDMLWGVDEMLLSALVVGSRGAVGSTYNVGAILYRQITEAFARGDLETAGQLQSRAVRMIGTLSQYPFHAAMKDLMGWIGLECGPCRLPQACLRDDEKAKLKSELEQIGFFQWGRPPIEPASAPAAGDVGA